MGNCCSGLIGNKKQLAAHKQKSKKNRRNSTNYADYYYDDDDDVYIDTKNTNNKHVGKAINKKHGKKYYAASDLANADFKSPHQQQQNDYYVRQNYAQQQTQFTALNHSSSLYNKNSKFIQQSSRSSTRRGGDNSQIINNINNDKLLGKGSQNYQHAQFISNKNFKNHVNTKDIDSGIISSINNNDNSSSTGLISLNSSSSVLLANATNLNNNKLSEQSSMQRQVNEYVIDENQVLNLNQPSSQNQLQSSSSNSIKLNGGKQLKSNHLLKLRKRDNFLNHSLNETDRNLVNSYKIKQGAKIENYDSFNNVFDSNEILKERSNSSNYLNNDDVEYDYDDEEDEEDDDEDDGYSEEDDEDEYGENQFSNRKASHIGSKLNSKNYRSLQKSKRSIKTIEKTMKNSRSIEQWLNDFGKLQMNYSSQSNGNKMKSLSIMKKLQQKQIANNNNKKKQIITNLGEIDEKQGDVKKSTYEPEQMLVVEEAEEEEEEEDEMEVDEEIEDEFKKLLNDLNKDYEKDDLNFKSFLHQLVKSCSMSPNSSSSQLNNRNSSFTSPLSPHTQASTNLLNVVKLIDTIGHLMKLNHSNRIELIEKQMQKHLNKFIVPRSLANSDDIEYLNWLLNDSNFKLTLAQPIINESVYTMDHLNICNQTTYNYILNPTNLNVNLVEINDLYDDEYEEQTECLSAKNTNFVKFLLLTNEANYLGDEQKGYLVVANKKIESILNKEKQLIQNNIKIAKDSCQDIDNELARFRLNVMSDSNFKGAKCLLNIKNKQILNRKTTTTSLNMNKYMSSTSPKVATTTTIPNHLKARDPISSLGSSLSPSSTSSLSNPNQPIDLVKSTSSTNSSTNNECNLLNTDLSYNILYSDLNEKLFSCLLSNFSCKLVENFLMTSTQSTDNQCLLKTGFIRKQKLDKSFTYINVVNEPSSNLLNEMNDLLSPKANGRHSHSKKHLLNLNVDKNTIKLYIKLNKWPSSYTKEYFKRKRLNLKWPNKKLLDYIELNSCLISTTTLDDSASNLWQVDTCLAESLLFKSFNRLQSFIFYFFYLIFQNLQINLTNTLINVEKLKSSNDASLSQLANSLRTTKFYLFHFVNERIFVHHFFRFFELNNFDLVDESNSHTNKNLKTNKTLVYLFDLIKKFSAYLRFVIEKYKTFNKPNYFDLNKLILNKDEYNMHLLTKIHNLSNLYSANDLQMFLLLINEDLITSLNNFEQTVENNLLLKLNKQTNSDLTPNSGFMLSNNNISLSNNLNIFDTFLDLIQIRFSNLNNIQLTSSLLLDLTKSKNQQVNNLNNCNNEVSIKLRNYTSLETIIEKHNSINTDSSASPTTTSSSSNSPSTTLNKPIASKYYSPLISHYSANTYVYLYIYEFFNALFEQFKSKRDHFQISEKLLLEIHDSLMKKNEMSNYKFDKDMFIESIKHIDKDQLFSKFEEYAECVHKYLPQIRQQNQYLLFHYIWTMQVQYLGPFFNFLCDFYPSIN